MQRSLRYIYQEIILYAGRKGMWISVCLFFIIACLSFPFTLHEAPASYVWHGVLWLLFLITPALSAATLFSEDKSSGRLERSLPAYGGVAVFTAKWIVCWILYALPSALAAPCVAYMTGAPFPDIHTSLCLFLSAGAISSLLCTFCGAISVGGGHQSTAGAVLVMPLYVPLWIFGAMGSAAPEQSADAFILFGACLLLFTPICVWIGSLLLRESIS